MPLSSPGSVADSAVQFSDITTNDSSTTKHGFLKKLDGSSSHFLDGTGAWATPAGGTVTLIQDSTLGADGTFDFSSISSSYKHLVGFYRLRGAAAAGTVNVWMRLNNDSGGNYQQVNSSGTGAASQAQGLLGTCPASTATANDVGGGFLYIPDYTSTSWFKIFVGLTAFWNEGVTSGMGVQANMWDNTGAINRIQLLPSSGNWLTNSRFTLYGIS